MVKIWIGDDLLDMSDDSQLQMDESSPLFENELQSGVYSIPFTIPLTDRNKKIFGNPQLMNNANADLKYEVTFERASDVKKGILYIDKITYDSNSSAGIALCTIAGVDGLFFSLITDKKLADLTYGGVFEIPEYTPVTDYDSDEENTLYHSNACFWASDIANGVITDMPFCFPMIKWDNFAEWEEITFIDSTYRTPTLIEGFVNYYTKAPFNHLNTGAQYEGVTILPVSEPAYNRLIPMFYRGWVLKKVFEEFGFTLTGDFLNDATFNKVYLVSNFSINKWKTYDDLSPTHDSLYWIDYATEVNPQNHMPDISVVDFINDTCRNFNFRIIPVSDTEFTIIRKTDVINTADKLVLDRHKISPVWDKMIAETEVFRRGTNLEYTNVDDWLESILPKPTGVYRGEVPTSSDLLSITDAAEGDIYSVTNTGWIYRYSEANGAFGLYSTNLCLLNLVQYNPANQISFEGSPLAMEANMSFKENNALVVNDYEGTFPHIDMQGMWYKNNGKLTEFVSMPLRQMIYMGLQYNTDDAGHPTPFSSYRNRNTANSVVCDWALHLYGNEGIYETFYGAWDRAKAASIKYQIVSYLTDAEVQRISFTTVLHALNQHFLVYSKKYKAPYTGICSLQVYKI